MTWWRSRAGAEQVLQQSRETLLLDPDELGGKLRVSDGVEMGGVVDGGIEGDGLEEDWRVEDVR